MRQDPVNYNRRYMLAVTAVLLAGSSLAGLGQANAQEYDPTKPFILPQSIWEGSVRRAERYLEDKEAYAAYQERLAAMLEGIKAGQDPHMLIREVVLSEEETREKLEPFIGVAGTEEVFALCMLTVLATLATAQQP